MKRFVEGDDRRQTTLFPEALDDYIADDNPVRTVDLFVDHLDLGALGFKVVPATKGRPAYHPSVLLKLYLYGYLNRIQSSRRLEGKALRNVELMWLTGRLAPDFKTADFRRDHGPGLRGVCRQFVLLCRELNLFNQATVAIDGSKFKAVNAHDRNFTRRKLEKHIQQIVQGGGGGFHQRLHGRQETPKPSIQNRRQCVSSNSKFKVELTDWRPV
ncbi:Transposase [Methylomagnum ishizawai]|uniref:Transposase n=1 Tax=Methylomagnum ishizawai TaxID=1760988 RepID=A0A1Y6D5J7_9GAMM|nr:Transposase [Methylomagnum ishizawai]